MEQNNLIDAIIYCMENQNIDFYFNPSTLDISEIKKNNYVELPKWSSFDGFQNMENFTASLKNKIHRDELIDVLKNGKGVFRNFKDVLKKYPSLEYKYKQYKYNEIKNRVVDFLDSLSINKSLFLTNEDNGYELNLSDFDIKIIDEKIEIESPIIKKDFISNIEYNDKNIKTALIKDTDNNNIGVINYFIDDKTIIITYYYVEPNFRDLGLFKLAFNSIIKNENCDYLIISVVNKDQILSTMIENLNFEKVYTEYKIKL